MSESNTKALIERLNELETRLLFNEDTINQLNDVITQQDKELTAQQVQLVHLAKKIEDLVFTVEQGNPISSGQEKPPHY